MSEASVAPGEDLHSRGDVHRKVSKDSHRISKKKCRPPVVIYAHSPKVIHTQPHSFMSLVQKLTGRSAAVRGSSSVMVADPSRTNSPRSPLESSFELNPLFGPQLSDPRSRAFNPQMTLFSSTSSSNLVIAGAATSKPNSRPQMLLHQHQDVIQSPASQGRSQSNCHDGGDIEPAPPFPGYNPSLESTGAMVALENIRSFTLT